VNLYPEIDELGTGKDHEVAALIGTPGLALLLNLNQGPFRGIFLASNGDLLVASYNKVYKVSSAFTKTEIGTLTTFADE
jgi:hypothetical protein